MVDAIGTLHLRIPGSAADASRLASAAAVARAALSSTAWKAPAQSDEPVLLVRRLGLPIPIRSGSSPERAASVAGRSLEPLLRRRLRQRDPGLEVQSFSSQAEYLAHVIEQCIHHRPLSAWYFKPLAHCFGPTPRETLRRLAEAEPAAWEGAVRLLRARGLLHTLLRFLRAEEYGLLFGGDRACRRLTSDEARPLFRIAWALSVPDVNAQDCCEADLRSYLSTLPEAPASWSDWTALAEVVARMVQWLLARSGARASGEMTPALPGIPAWLDPDPIRRALEPKQPSATSGSRTAPQGGSEPMAIPVSAGVNRTAALRVLEVAELRVAGGGAASDQEKLSAALELVIREAAGHDGCSDPAAIAALLADRDWNPGDPAAAHAVRRLRQVVKALTVAERERLVRNLSAQTDGHAREIPTGCAGLFLLIRPVMDLRIPGLITRETGGLDALRNLLFRVARRVSDDPVELDPASCFAFGAPRETQSSPEAAITDLALEPERLLERLLGQLVSWLHGFEKSTPRFVLDRLIRRPGLIHYTPGARLKVEWRGSALDFMLDRAGYLDPLDAVPWWDGRGLEWLR